MRLCLRPTRKDNGDEQIKYGQPRFNAQHSGAATVPQVLMGLWRVYDPTWRVKEGHLLPVSDPEKVCFGCPKSAAMIFFVVVQARCSYFHFYFRCLCVKCSHKTQENDLMILNTQSGFFFFFFFQISQWDIVLGERSNESNQTDFQKPLSNR